MGKLPQALEIIFEVQRKMGNEIIIIIIIKAFQLTKHFFFSFLFGPLLLSNLITFLIFIHFK
jgi:hypothetical protein